jgi:hypothetical protein
MEIPICSLQIGQVKASVQIAGILVLAGMNVQGARNSRPADVMVYVNGDGGPPGPADEGARATVTRMFDKIGVRLAWRDGIAGSGPKFGGPISIQVLFSSYTPKKPSQEALAFTLPFADGVTTITVMYHRIVFVAGRGVSAESILAQVLAHEIGHVLQVTNQHSQTGVMKANLTPRDYQAIQRKPLEFTHYDIALIVQGLAALKARTATETAGGDLMRRPADGQK